jgi:hypothetical protein
VTTLPNGTEVTYYCGDLNKVTYTFENEELGTALESSIEWGYYMFLGLGNMENMTDMTDDMLGDLIGDLGLGNMENMTDMTDDMLGDLIGDLGLGNVENMTESEATDMLGGILEGLGLGSLRGGLLGDLDLGNMTEDDLDGILGDLGLGNMTEDDLNGILETLASGTRPKLTLVVCWGVCLAQLLLKLLEVPISLLPLLLRGLSPDHIWPLYSCNGAGIFHIILIHEF